MSWEVEDFICCVWDSLGVLWAGRPRLRLTFIFTVWNIATNCRKCNNNKYSLLDFAVHSKK